MPRSRRNRRSVSKRFRTRQKLKLETLEKRFALDADSPSISLPTNGFGPGAVADSGAPINVFLSQQNQVPFSGSADTEAGIVITSLNLQGGKLWYSTTSGSAWSQIESASPTSGTVLIDDGSTRLHYEPPAEFSGQAEDVFTFRAYCFSENVLSGTSQFDASAGSPLQTVGSYAINHELMPHGLGDGGKVSLFSDGSRAAVIHDDGLEILDISNLSSIQRVGIMRAVSDPAVSGGLYSDVHIAGDESSIFINPTLLTTDGAFVVDLTTPTSPELLPHYTAAFSWTITANDDGSMVVLGSTGGPEGQGSSNLHFYNTTDRANPQLLSSLNLTIPALTEGSPPYEYVMESDLEAHELTLSPDANTLYVSCISEYQLGNEPLFFVVDISDIQQPQVVAEIPKNGLEGLLAVHALSPDGNTLFVAGEKSSHTGNKRFLSAYDVSSPSLPVRLWQYEVPDLGGDERDYWAPYAHEVVYDAATGKIYVAYDSGVRAFEFDQSGVVSDELVSPAEMSNGVAVSADGQNIFVMGPDLLSVYAASQGTSVDVTLASGETGDNNWHPVLDTSADVRLPDVVTDAGSPSEILQARPNAVIGTPVSRLIDRDGPLSNYADPDFADETYGLAITRTNTAGGTLWFSIDGGSTWADVGVVSDSSARVLEANDDTRLYYQPPTGTIGNIYDAFSYKAWDTSGGYQNGDAGVDTNHTAGLGENLMANMAFTNPSNGDAVFARQHVFSNDNDYMYVTNTGSWTGYGFLGIIEVTSSNELVQRGSLGLSFVPQELVVSQDGTKIFAVSEGSIEIVDVTYPDSPNVVSSSTSGLSFSGDGMVTPTEVRLTTFIPGELKNTYFGTTIDNKFCIMTYGTMGLSVNALVSLPDLFGPPEYVRANSLVVHPDGQHVIVKGGIQNAGAGYLVIINVSSLTAPLITDVVNSPSGLSNSNSLSDLIISNDGNVLSYLDDGRGTPESNIVNIDISDRSDLRVISHTKVPYGDQNGLHADGDYFLWSIGQGNLTGINNQNPFNPTVVGEYSIPLMQTGNYMTDGTSFGTENGFLGKHPYLMANENLELYMPDYKASFSNEAEVVRVRITQNSPSVFEGDTSGVLNVGRAAYGFLACSDTDGLQQGVLSVAADGAKGDASVLPAGNGGWQWYYHAGPLFDGDDSFAVTLIDDLGVETQQTITITGEPSQTVGPLTNMAVHQNQSGSLVSYSVPAVGLQGQPLNGGFARVVATSSNSGLVPNPTVVYSSPDVPSVISFVPSAGESGSTTLSIQVETGGADDDLATVGDNAFATHQVEVTVLEVISSQGSTVLAKDASESLYVNAQPVTYNQQHVPQAFIGSDVTGVESSDEGNALLLRHSASQDDGPTHRLITDNAFRINGIFNSLQNESPRVLDISGREVSKNVNIVAVAGAYEINGVRNPTIVMRRGQTYTVNVNAPSDPIWLQTTGNGFDYTSGYRNGFSPNGETSGEYEWVVPADAPDELFYQGWIQPEMFGKIIIVD